MKRYIKSDRERGYFYDRLTDNGKKTWRDVEDFPSLFQKFDEMTGFVAIPKPEFKKLQSDVNAFLKARPDWGIYYDESYPWYEDDGREYLGSYFLGELSDFASWDMDTRYDKRYKEENGLV